MMLVMDSSSALKWALPEPFSAQAENLRDNFHHHGIALIAPDIFSIETLHALTKAERQKRIPHGSAYPLWQLVHADCPILHPHIPLLDRAYEIAAQARIGIYDCVYIALAERESCELATADDRIIKSLQGSFPFIRHLGTFP